MSGGRDASGLCRSAPQSGSGKGWLANVWSIQWELSRSGLWQNFFIFLMAGDELRNIVPALPIINKYTYLHIHSCRVSYRLWDPWDSPTPPPPPPPPTNLVSPLTEFFSFLSPQLICFVCQSSPDLTWPDWMHRRLFIGQWWGLSRNTESIQHGEILFTHITIVTYILGRQGITRSTVKSFVRKQQAMFSTIVLTAPWLFVGEYKLLSKKNIL